MTRWLVAAFKPISLPEAKLAIARAFGVWPKDDDVEIVTDAPDIDGRLYVVDVDECSRLPEPELHSSRWLR